MTSFSPLRLLSPLQTYPTPGVLPVFTYGTAWKRHQTSQLVDLALRSAFTAIDTACQPKHYREDLVGSSIRSYLSSPDCPHTRSDLYIQTKFTSVRGQDLRDCPYDIRAGSSEQVKESVEVSLKNFHMGNEDDSYVDCLVLHSPMDTFSQTLGVWRALETYVPRQIRRLGISNTDLRTLKALWEQVEIKPAVVQNRFYADTGYDVELRQWCRDKRVVYQSFWTLTANPRLLKGKAVGALSERLGIERTSALYCCVIGLGGVSVLNGSGSAEHIRGDWEAVRKVREWAHQNVGEWEGIMGQFRSEIGEI